MGRSFESVRMGVKEVSARWSRAGRALKREDQICGQKLSDMAKKHSSEAFYALDDPLEAGVFSALIEILKEMEDTQKEMEEMREEIKRLQ
jgi:hypothetical protein